MHYNTEDLIEKYNEKNLHCGRLVSVVGGWMCEKCGVAKFSTNEVWNEQVKCKERTREIIQKRSK